MMAPSALERPLRSSARLFLPFCTSQTMATTITKGAATAITPSIYNPVPVSVSDGRQLMPKSQSGGQPREATSKVRPRSPPPNTSQAIAFGPIKADAQTLVSTF